MYPAVSSSLWGSWPYWAAAVLRATGERGVERGQRACLAALQRELELTPDAGLDTASWREDGDRVSAEWRYGSVRAGSGVMPAESGQVTCAISGGEVASVDIERW